MERWSGKVALVTGASSGIGAAIAVELVKRGMKVVGIARRVENVEEQQSKVKGAKGKLYPLKGDVSKEADIINVFDWIKKNLGTINVLVNNAGFSKFGKLTDMNPSQFRDMVDVNVIGLSICTQQAYKLMKATGVDDGHIIHINSVAGHMVPNIGDPVFNIYPATKYAVTALTETLRQELRFLKSNIRVTQLSPGKVNTDFLNVATKEAGSGANDAREMIKSMNGLKPQDLADAIVYVLSTPAHVNVQDIIIEALE